MFVCHTCPVGGLWCDMLWHGRVGYVLFRSWKVLQCDLLLCKMMRMWRTGFIIATLHLIFQIPAKTGQSNSIRSLPHSNVPDSIPDTHSKTRYSGRPHGMPSIWQCPTLKWCPDNMVFTALRFWLPFQTPNKFAFINTNKSNLHLQSCANLFWPLKPQWKRKWNRNQKAQCCKNIL